jgi:hypothetical protein
MKWILAAAAVGFVLMFFFESPLTRALGLLCLFGFIVGGVFLIADPVALGKEEEPMRDERAP